MPNESERALAIFVDFDNIAQGFRRTDRFDIQRVLKRMVEKGKIVSKKTYADWSRYLPYTASLHEAAFELVEIPKRSMTGKNSADIRLCVDAMDLAYSKPHIDTFVIVSGDSDFTPLVSKLKEMGKHVIGLGMSNSTSDLLRDNCDEFIYYEDLEVEKADTPKVNLPVPDTKRKALELLLEACVALRRENKEVLWASMIKETMKRKKPSFNETYHGFATFSALLEDAQAQGLVELERDAKRGTYSVVRFGAELSPHVRKESPRTRGKETHSLPSRAPVKGTPTKRGIAARPERDVGLERIPATRPIAAEIKPRETRFQGFSDFAEETSQFLGKQKSAAFEDEFAEFSGTQRSPFNSTADEVMANLAESRKTTERPVVEKQVDESEVIDTEDMAAPESEEKDKFKKRRRRGKGKEKPNEEPVTVPTVIEDMPISFDDIATPRKAEPVDASVSFASFEEAPVSHDVPSEIAVAAVEPSPAPIVKPVEEKPAVEEREQEQRRGFGFGIFDE
ncbi:MAG: NYN domain-containing protein [Planctomycetia bacterium]|nr:NYN domain-containing protein [Planctomycetia bacterium]